MKKVSLLASLCMVFVAHVSAVDLVQPYQRLGKHVEQLRMWATRYRAIFMPPMAFKPIQYSFSKHQICEYHNLIKGIAFVHEGYMQFQHTAVSSCVAVIQQEERLDAFFAMWDAFVQKTSNGTVFGESDELFLKECSTLVLLFYNNILREHNTLTSIRISVTDILEMYDAIAKLPLNELLDLLDTIFEKISTLMQSEMSKPENQNIFEWLHENWWVPPVVLGALIAQLIVY